MKSRTTPEPNATLLVRLGIFRSAFWRSFRFGTGCLVVLPAVFYGISILALNIFEFDDWMGGEDSPGRFVSLGHIFWLIAALPAAWFTWRWFLAYCATCILLCGIAAARDAKWLVLRWVKFIDELRNQPDTDVKECLTESLLEAPTERYAVCRDATKSRFRFLYLNETSDGYRLKWPSHEFSSHANLEHVIDALARGAPAAVDDDSRKSVDEGQQAAPTSGRFGAVFPRRDRTTFSLRAVVVGAVLSYVLMFAFSRAIVADIQSPEFMSIAVWATGRLLTGSALVIAGYVTARIAGMNEIRHCLVAAILNCIWTAAGLFESSDRIAAFSGLTAVNVLMVCADGLCMMLIGGYYAATLRLATERRHASFLLLHGITATSFGLVLLAAGAYYALVQARGILDVLLYCTVLYFGCYAVAEGLKWLKSRKWYMPDDRPPIMILRSFDDDLISLPLSWRERIIPWSYLPVLLRLNRPTLEGALVRQLADYGPVFAVADPSYDLFDFGAIRERLDAGWLEKVANYMEECGLIVVVLGSTHGLRLEMEELISRNSLAKCLFVFPPTGPDDSQSRWHAFRSILDECGVSHTAANLADNTLCARLIQDGSFVFFQNHGYHENAYREAIRCAIEAIEAIRSRESALAQ